MAFSSIETRQTSPFQRTKSFSSSSALNRRIIVSAPLETVISTHASGDLAVTNPLAMNGRLLPRGSDAMDGLDKNRARSGSILQAWFGGSTADNSSLNEVEQAELEIERMIAKIRRDLSHMHDQDLYFSKWIGTLGRKINNLESSMYMDGDAPPISPRDEVDNCAHIADETGHDMRSNNDAGDNSTVFSPQASSSNTTFSELNAQAYKPLSRSSSQISAATASSGVSSGTGSSADPDSDYSADSKLQTITERHPVSSQSSQSGVQPRVTSCDSVDSLFRKSGDMQQGLALSRQDSASSGIHADEILAMYSKREKGVRQELGLSSQGGTPSKHDLRSPSNRSLVHEHPDENEESSATTLQQSTTPQQSNVYSPNRNSDCADSNDGSNQLPNPLIQGAETPKPVLVYSEIFAPPSSATESLTCPTSPTCDDDFLTPRLAKRNSGIFGSVRLRNSLRNITRGKSSGEKSNGNATPTSGEPESPTTRTDKPRWRWGGSRVRVRSQTDAQPSPVKQN